MKRNTAREVATKAWVLATQLEIYTAALAMAVKAAPAGTFKNCLAHGPFGSMIFALQSQETVCLHERIRCERVGEGVSQSQRLGFAG